jgi:vacuolar protein sorting-associated protein 13A/C
MSIGLKFCEFGWMDDATQIKSQEKMALYHTSKSHIRWLCLQLSSLDEVWSSPVDIQQIGKSFVKVDKGNAEIPYLVRVSVHMKDSTIFVTLNEDKDWPFRIENNSSVEVQFIQEVNPGSS